MPRFFFDVSNGSELVDDDGIVLPDATEARRQGIVAAGAMFSDDGHAIASGEIWSMKIMDESRAVVCTIRFTVND